ncbi:MAG: flippase [Chthoniobacteraceae bacterium]|jgi:O-antigen/teichoic acid export membrane protein
MKQSQRIVKNVFASGLAVGLGGMIQLAAVALVARSVGIERFGVYSFILAFAMFFQQLADLGLCNILIREIARAPGRYVEIFGAALSLIWLLTGAAALVMGGITPFLHFSIQTKLLAMLMGAATLAQFHAMGYGAVLRAKEENELHALGFFLHKVLFFACIAVSLKCRMALLGIVLAHLIPSLFQWSLYRWIVSRRYGHAALARNPAMWKYLLTHSIPVGGATMLRLLSQQVDIFILTWMRDLRSVGLFSGPYRISMSLRFIPQTMSLPLYPMYSRMAHAPGEQAALQGAYVRSVKYFLIMGLPVTIMFAGFAPVVIALFLGPKYREATAAMQWVGLAFLPFFISDPMPFLLTALEQQRFVMWSTIIAMSLRAGLNFLLIPMFGYVGPCIAFFVGETVLLGLMMGGLARRGYGLRLMQIAWRPLIAAGCMLVVLWPCRGLSLALALPAALGGLAVYCAVVWKLGTFSAEEIETAVEASRFVKPMLEKWTRHAEHTVV